MSIFSGIRERITIMQKEMKAYWNRCFGKLSSYHVDIVKEFRNILDLREMKAT
jgi:hypothetical protein